jgi:hypothetical protein
MQVTRTIGMTRGAEEQLAAAFTLLADRHARDPEVRDACSLFARWSSNHVAALDPVVARYGEQITEQPLRLRSAMFYGTRVGGLGLLQDLQDLSLLVQHARMSWTVLAQAAAELRDREMQRVCFTAAWETDRQAAWVKTLIKHVAGQAQTVSPPPMSELRASLPKTPTIAAVPDPAWGPLAGGVLIAIVGLLSLAVGEPWIVPSLGPTAYLQAETPALPSSRLYNTIVGHLCGLVVGFFVVWALGARDDAVTLTTGDVTGGRVAAATVALALTMFLAILLHASHPPAGATTLLVALGSIHNADQALYLMLGVLVIAIAGEVVRRIRLGDVKTLLHAPRRREMVRIPRVPRITSPHG